MLDKTLIEWGCEEVSAIDVYKDMFRLGEGYLQKRDEPPGQFKANPIAYYRNNGESKGHYRILFEDEFEQLLPELQQSDFCILNGISYFGRRNVQLHASKMFAMIFDLDGVTDKTLNSFLYAATLADHYPIPNYFILSGSGLHLYYIFEFPIPLYPNIKLQLKELKYSLTERIWNNYTSTFRIKQKQGINQGFRIIGGKTKPGSKQPIVRAFRKHTNPFSLSELCQYTPDEIKIDEKKLFRESKLSLEEAKKKYPQWYEKVVVNKDTSRIRWEIEKKVHGKNPYALYDWWKKQVLSFAAYNHRYFCMMCLTIYAVKCNVPFEKLQKDVYDFIPILDAINPSEPFTKEDADSALECYDLRYCTFPIKDIATLSAITIKKNKRNGRKMKVHLMGARALQEIDDKVNGTNWREGNGRKPLKEIVLQYKKDHPFLKKADCIRDTGLSKATVYKWWNSDVTE